MIGVWFAVPGWWPALLVLPLLAWVAVRGDGARAAQRQRCLGRREDALLGTLAHGRLRLGCGAAAVGLTVVALLRPVWGTAPGEPLGPDVVCCLDVSRSMLARDVAPSRLAAAQHEVQALCEVAVGGRVGLVAFAGEPRLAVPLSADLAAVAAMAAELDPSSVARGGTDLGAAIDLAAATLQRTQRAAGSIVVLTDGEDFAGRGQAAAARARQAGWVVDCIAFGSAAGSKVVVDSPAGEVFLRDAAGQEVVSALDPASLRAVAAAGGGEFDGGGPGALARLHSRALLPRALAAAIADPQREQAHRFQWPLLAALLLWMLRSALPERRR